MTMTLVGLILWIPITHLWVKSDRKNLVFCFKIQNFALKNSGDRTSIECQLSHKLPRTLGIVLKWPQDLGIKSQIKFQDFCFEKFFTLLRFWHSGSEDPPNSYRVKILTKTLKFSQNFCQCFQDFQQILKFQMVGVKPIINTNLRL